ncbi:MAG: hypothetical protein HYS87_03445 [Candidatus Colwellbacteria bacterium]|nr:hypothetical protein [Candidatus Colwellbacteria bacterium]
MKVDYHFHPNLPKSDKRARRKVAKIYSKLQDAGIRCVIITEHVYKNYRRAWQMMLEQKPANISIFPGLEYVTKENIDICIFAETEKIYQHEFVPFKWTYEEVLAYLKQNTDIFGYVTHPLTLGQTSIVDKKGADFAKLAISQLGAVEASYTALSKLKNIIISKKTLNRIKDNENLPQEFYPKNIKFLTTGSDAHHPWDIGMCTEVEEKSSVFDSIISNKSMKVVGKRDATVIQTIRSILTVIHEWWLKIWYRLWK